MKNSFGMIYFLALIMQGTFIHANAQNTLPNSYHVFRDAVYMQNSSIDQIVRLYVTARDEIEQSFSGAEMYIALSRCAYLAGVTFQAEGRKNEAAAYYDQGIAWAENSIALRPTSEGYQYLAANLALSCWVKPLFYAIANHGKIDENAGKSLALNPQNLAAQYIIAAKYIQAPWPVGDVKRGASLLREIINQDLSSIEQEDVINIYLAMAVVCKKEKKYEEERNWQGQALAMYPTNRFRETLLQ